MTYTTNKLIANAYYLSGVCSRDTQTVTGDQITTGLDLLNDLLAIKTANSRLIPYFKAYTLNTVIGQEAYLIPGLIEATSVTYNIDTVRFPAHEYQRDMYNGSTRADDITSIPWSYNVERVKTGATLSFYFKPDKVYPIRVFGKFGLTSAALGADLEATYDRFYIVYLKYALAELICSDYCITFQSQADQKLRELESMIQDISPYDLQLKKKYTIGKTQYSLNYAQVNIGGPWVPS
jgi:hypothetical protein